MDYLVDYQIYMGYPYMSRAIVNLYPTLTAQKISFYEKLPENSQLIMQLNQTQEDSLGQYSQNISKGVKISIFTKPSITKVCCFLSIISLLAGTPSMANASFFSDLTAMVLGTEVTASENQVSSSNEVIHNSQNIPLLESSIDPDLKNINEAKDMIIVQDDSFIDSNGFFGPDVVFEKSSLSDQINVYTVKEGDTLSGLADLFDVSTNTIRWENNLSGQTITVGQKLNILPMTGVKHIVKSGDTISKIADKYDAETDDILIFNGLEKGQGLKQGEIIFVPNGIIKSVVLTKPSSVSSKSTSSNTKAPSGYYLRPVPGRVTSPYGSRRGGFHPGVDLAGTKGVTPVQVAASGVVVEVVSGCVEGRKSCGGRYGNHIEVEHPNGTKTRYAHLYKTLVHVGQTVSQGETIGILGNTGSSTGPHLHFEIENANGSKMRPPF